MPRAFACSSTEGRGVDEVWSMIEAFRDGMTASGVWGERRAAQNVDWFRSLLKKGVMDRFTEANRERIRKTETRVRQGETPVSVALDELLGDTGEAASASDRG